MGPPPRHPPDGHVNLYDEEITSPPPQSHDNQHQLIIHSQLSASAATSLPPALPPPATDDAFTPTLLPAAAPPLSPESPSAALPPPPPAATPLPPPPPPTSKSPQSSDQGKQIGKIKIKIPTTPPVFTNLLFGEGSDTKNKKNKNMKKKDGPRFCWPCQLWFKCGKALGGHRRHLHPKRIILALPAPNAPILSLSAPPRHPPPQAPPRIFAPPKEDMITSSPPSSKHQESNLLIDASSSSTITKQELEDPDLQDLAQTLLSFKRGPVILGKRPLLEIDEAGDLEQFITLPTNHAIPNWDLDNNNLLHQHIAPPIQQRDLIHPPLAEPVAPFKFQLPPITNRKEEEESVESVDAQNLELELATRVRKNSKEDIDQKHLPDSA